MELLVLLVLSVCLSCLSTVMAWFISIIQTVKSIRPFLVFPQLFIISIRDMFKEMTGFE